MSPAWIIRSAQERALIAEGGRAPCVSEIIPAIKLVLCNLVTIQEPESRIESVYASSNLPLLQVGIFSFRLLSSEWLRLFLIVGLQPLICHKSRKIGNSAGIAPFIVIPCYNLRHISGKNLGKFHINY